MVATYYDSVAYDVNHTGRQSFSFLSASRAQKQKDKWYSPFSELS